MGTSLLVHTPNVGGTGSIPDWELGSHMPQDAAKKKKIKIKDSMERGGQCPTGKGRIKHVLSLNSGNGIRRVSSV